MVFAALFLLTNTTITAQNKKYTIVLDAGHGGKDPGNLGNGFLEKNIALKVVLAVGKLLRKNNDINVIYTRKKDVFVELYNRAIIANKKEVDLFISVHCDSHTSNAFGAGTFVLGPRGNKENFEIAKRENSVILLEKDYKKNYDYNPDSPESMIGLSFLQEENLEKSLVIASLIQDNFVNKLKRNNRKVKQGNFLVLRHTIMPSVLIELGFLTNKKEGRYLNSKKGQEEMAIAISKGIQTYIKQLKLNTISSNKQLVPSALSATVVYKVQIASGKNKIPTKSYNFKGLKGVKRIKIDNYYKYYYGIFNYINEAKKAQKKAQEKGYRSAFIVAFKNGKKISIKEALKLQ